MPLTAELPRRTRLILYAITCLAAALHVGQSIVFHNAIPGDMADARLGNCILEHLYQSVRGHGDILSPAQFFPTKETLFYSDAHFGTAPLYMFFRLVRAGMPRAFQSWFLTIAATNAAALIFLLRRLRVHPFICCPLAFLGSASAALVFKAGHPQVLPFFPFVFALVYFVEFLRRADARAFAIAALWVAYQNACYLYDGYFTLLIFGILALVFFALNADREWLRRLRDSLGVHREFVAVAIAASLLVLFLLYYPYARLSAEAGTRSFDELTMLAPNPGAWLSASGFSPWYSHQNFYKPDAFIGENTLFAGWIIYLLAFGAIGFGLLQKRNSDLRLAAALALTSLFVIIAITSWRGGHMNLYLWLAERVASIRAFRSFGRIAYLLIVTQAIAGALLLQHFYCALSSRLTRAVVVLVALLAAVESLAVGQDYYLPRVARSRADAIIRQWQAAGFRKVLLFAPGFSNQQLEVVHLDCWHAALLTRQACVNGYSGNMPNGYYDFLAAPTPERAQALREQLALREDQISFVTVWSDADKEKLGIVTISITPNLAVITQVNEIRLHPLERATISATIAGQEAMPLDCDTLKIFASYRVYDLRGNNIRVPSSLRTPLHVIADKPTTPIALDVQAPADRGIYDMRLSIVQDGFAWWADVGGSGSTVRLIVE